MAKDIFIELDRCNYCGQPGVISWDVDLFSCSREVCKTLAYGEVKRRAHAGNGHPETTLEREETARVIGEPHELLQPHRVR